MRKPKERTDTNKRVGRKGVDKNITERKRMEESLRASEESCRLLAETAQDFIYIVNPDLTLKYLNSATARPTQKAPEDLLGKPVTALFPPGTFEFGLSKIREVFETSEEVRFDEQLHFPGKELWVDTDLMPMRDHAGKIIAVMGIARDITERKRAEIEVREKSEQLQQLSAELEITIDNIPGLVFYKDTHNRFIRVNKYIADAYGMTKKQLEGKNLLDLHSPEEAQAYYEDDLQVIRSGQPRLDIDEPWETEEGIRWVNTSKIPYRNEKGEVIGVIGVSKDITERKKMEEELRKHHEHLEELVAERTARLEAEIAERNKREAELAVAQQLYRELFENVNVGILRTTPGPEGTFIDVNPAMVKLFEADSREQLMALPPSGIYWDASQRKIVSDAIMAMGFANEEIRFKTLKGKPLWCHITSVNKTDAHGQVFFDNTIEDITERKRMEEELRRALADLARSNKELEQFAYVASHDLQEPLRMVSSYTQLLAQRYEGQLDAKAKKYIDYAVDGSVRMQRLINDLLTYSRISTRGKSPQPIDAHAVLGEAIRNLQAAIEESGALITNDDLPTVRADTSQLLQVFQNLIANAIKFQGDTPPRIHVSAQDQGGEWLFSVRDNGIGIDREYADRLFVIFQRLHTRQEYPGTGIGLAVCKRIVERHGGRIWFESEPGKGSTFFFTISK